jgi:ribosomal protein S18 acetylase RimI-like enzyme
MFNAAFPNAPMETRAVLEERLLAAKGHFDSQALRWALWICEDYIATGVRRKLSGTCDTLGLRLSSEMPGMVAERIRQPSRKLPALDFRRVDSPKTLDDFRALGSVCFHVPIAWFSEVFDTGINENHPFVSWVGYREGEPVATAATVTANGVIGLYNIATSPDHRHRGYGEAITRHAIDAALGETGSRADSTHVVLQSTSLGLRLYERMGFQPVTRILVYNSVP